MGRILCSDFFFFFFFSQAVTVVDSKTKADCVLKMGDKDCYDIMTGAANAQTAFMSGKLKVFNSSFLSSFFFPPLSLFFCKALKRARLSSFTTLCIYIYCCLCLWLFRTH